MVFLAFIQAVQSILPFLLIGALGYFLAGRGWFSKDSAKLLSDLVMIVSVPVYLLRYIGSAFSRAELYGLLFGTVPPFLSIVVNLAVGFILCKWLKIAADKRGVFVTSFAFSNTIFIGLPINLALFGEAALPYVLLYYFANTVLFWTVGYYLLSPENGAAILGAATLKRFLSPPMLGFLGGLALVLADLRLPLPLAKAADYVGNLTTPLVLLSLGLAIYAMRIRRENLDWGLFAIVAGRVLFSPLVVVGIMFCFDLPELMSKVFIMQSSLPAMSSIAMIQLHYKADTEYAAMTIALTTLMSIATIPLIMAGLEVYFS